MPALATRGQGSEAKVLVGLWLEPQRQPRWSVFLRLFMALPLFLVVIGAEFIALFVIIAAWFTALFTGRVSDGMQSFITKFSRLFLNVSAYTVFLTPRWPGVRFNERSDDPLTLQIDHVRLRRASVFFRYILAVPSSIVVYALWLGSIPMIGVAWLFALVTGRVPRGLHQALALVVRFQARQMAYLYLLSPTQPFRGFFGDGDQALDASTALLEDDAAPTSGVVADAPPTRWLVAKSAKVLVVVILILSVPGYVFYVRLDSPLLAPFQRIVSHFIVATVNNVSTQAMSKFEAEASACTSNNRDACVASAAGRAYSTLSAQSSILTNNQIFPGDDRALARRYVYWLNTIDGDLLSIEGATSSTTQSSIINVTLPKALHQFHLAYQNLESHL